jgi:hypothetical protein
MFDGCNPGKTLTRQMDDEQKEHAGNCDHSLH